ncbi:monovalent cation/H+ antiporter subunit D [Acinetobacter qingfengensis]|uniref:Monovalent cation/H+ antiporter subunit D n=1 Tax=Acinetobacter qingfengensis TaxID=1262585 RepID=A0A1E7RDJ8_9GAMM|nr:monovalent cation/H+ antiporter subunit D [Acinetobacter qingfengensis]KAA8733714.1 monovalent cation/H+ antiporter subunit D [Acinetobacter qingfengensis]OEY97470.1 monovalent cation/H+ antiporter subunit D [Acinetobacter qingfengensis]
MNIFVDFWQQHFPILSILVPAITGFILILLGNPGAGTLKTDWRQPLRHLISLSSTILGFILAVMMLIFANSGQIQHYELSEWSAPFGIVLVVDRLSALMVMLTYILAVPVLWYASAEWDQRGRYFHAMSHFLLMGMCGAFLTGDLFNLFVFFEILLMASYVLLLHGHSKSRFTMGVHYVIINLLASSFFLIGLGLIYANVGSLNMADVARLFPNLDDSQHQMALAGSMLLLVVFAIKAAIFPVGFWLPKTYAVAATPVAAIFALMTKVGIYAILRVNGTVFSDPEGQRLFEQWLLILGVITSIYGVIGAIGAERLRRMIGFMIISSLGTILIGISLFTQQTWAAALYYLVHSTLIAACFYLLAEWITVQRGTFKDHLKLAPVVKQQRLLSLLYLLIALIMAGLPPFSGFLGKVLLLQGTGYHAQQIWIILAILLVSLLSILAFVRNGFILFWRATPAENNPEDETFAQYQTLPDQPTARANHVIYVFLATLILYAVCADPVYRYTYATAEQLMDKTLYQQTILKTDATQNVISVQPFDSNYLPELKYGATSDDPYQQYIPYIISPKTLQGEHIPEEKLKKIAEQHAASPDQDAKLVPAE